jgi:FixJ family two-component response regulator
MCKYAIICVDDDPMINLLLNFQLNKIVNSSTTCIETYSNPKEIYSQIENFISIGVKPILLIVDYQMPEMNGDELIIKVKEKYPNIPCVMLSGQANAIAINQLKKDKLLSEFIEKPWNEETLATVVNSYIDI